jgi:Ca-activated chloride channel homolog
MKNFRLILPLLAFVCLASLPVFSQTGASKDPKIMFVLDASGSMWGKVGAEEKIVAAKRVLKGEIAKLPDTAEAGLIAYGHRSKTDCNDIETLSAIKPVDKAGLSKQVDGLDPKGKTPTTNALRKAIEEVRARKTTDTVKIVLVSDGLETCDGNPCKLIREARAAGVNITLHVIGFDVGQVSVAQLECTAQAGGGLYFDAQNAEGLAAALAAATGDVEKFGSCLSVKAIADGKLTDAVVIVTRAGIAVTSGRTYESEETNPRVLPLHAGTYDVTVTGVNLSGGPTRRLEKVKIADGETVERTVDFSAGGLFVRVTRNGKLSDAVVQVFTAGTTKAVASGRTYDAVASNPLNLRVAPGRYDVVIKPIEIAKGFEKKFTGVVIAGDGQVDLTHDFLSGTLRIGSVRGSELVDSVLTIYNLDTKQHADSGRTYAAANTNPSVFTLQPGRYRVHCKAVRPAGLRPKEIVVVIKAGETVEQTVSY